MKRKLLVVVLVLAFLLSILATTAFAATENMFGTRTGSSFNESTAYELGTIFKASVAGRITGVRVYTVTGETGNHTVRIWNNSTNTVVGGPYTWSYTGSNTWKTYTLTTPITIQANVNYTVVVSTGADAGKYYTAKPSDLLSAGSNSNHLSWPANAGVYTLTVGARPTSATNGNNYLRDVVFEATGSATPTPTPTPLSAYPNSSNTGPAAAGYTNLTAYTGPMTITTPNTVISGKIITGALVIKAANVTIQGCRIHGATDFYNDIPLVRFEIGSNGSKLLDCNICGDSATDWTVCPAAGVKVHAPRIEMRRNNFYWIAGDCINLYDLDQSAKIKTNCDYLAFTDNYMHAFTYRPGGTDGVHYDGYDDEVGTNYQTVRHNTMEMWVLKPNGEVAGMSSVLVIYKPGYNNAASDNIIAGGSWTLAGKGFSVINNRFSAKFSPDCGAFGIPYPSQGQYEAWSGNVWNETGVTIPMPPAVP